MNRANRRKQQVDETNLLADGNTLYGTTFGGGAQGYGTVFGVTVP